MIKLFIEFLIICLLLYGWAHEDKVAEWERQTAKKFWRWLTRHVNRMIRAYEMAHQEAKK